jgi:acetyl esterase/lipase
VSSEKDVEFAAADGLDLKLDIYRPDGPPNGLAILFLHGGGWRGGAKEMMRPVARAMAEHGFVGLPAQYRVTTQAPWPAQIDDVRTAIGWIRQQSDQLGIDPDRIVLWGSSAGAHLALLAAGTPHEPSFDSSSPAPPAGDVANPVGAVVAVHAPTNLYIGGAREHGGTPATVLLGEDGTPEAARAASPLTYVSPRFPPTLLLHGTDDRVVHHSASQQMQDAMRAVHAPADLHLYHGHTHGFAAVPSMRAAVVSEAAFFLERTLVDPVGHQEEIDEFSIFAGRVAASAAEAAST